MTEVPWTLKRGKSPHVVLVDIPINAGQDVWMLLRGDAHHDNPLCRQDLEKAHLDEALERGAMVWDNGDLFCAMQGKYDRRSSKSSLRPEHQSGDYLDKLVTTAADFYEPYAHLWINQMYGNHETSICDRHETDLLQRLSATLRDRTGAMFPVTGYTSWAVLRFRQSNLEREGNTGPLGSVCMWGIHGYGGGGPVTQDNIQRNRQMSYVENADIMTSGHTHDSWGNKTQKLRMNKNTGEEKTCPVTYIKTPSYKDEYKDQRKGWHKQTGKPPKPLGATWVRFFMHSHKIYWETTEAFVPR